MDHLRHFGLSDDPFRDEPRVRDFFESRGAAEALLRLGRGLRQARGLCVVSGEHGAGKSMLVRRLLEALEEELFEASVLVVLPGAGDAGALLARFARHLGVESPAPDRQALLAQLYEQLAIVREDGRHAVLMVDDADQLAHGSALAELAGLLRLEYEERRLLSLVLSGAHGLDAALAADPALGERVDARVRLAPLSGEEAALYLAHRLKLAGGDPTTFTSDALDALHRLGRGMPGRINRLADNALFEAFLCGRSRVTRADVERAQSDLGEALATAVPAPARPEPPPAPSRSPRHAEAEAMPLAPFAGAGDELDSELEAIFDDADAAPPRTGGLRGLRGGRDDAPVARLLED